MRPSIAHDDPARPLTAIMPRWLIVVITVAAILLLIGFLIAGSFWPLLFQHNAAKFFVCTMLAFCFSIVMFVIYPQNIRIKKIPGIDLAVEVVGPPALFLATLPLLWHYYPGPVGRVYRFQNLTTRLRVPTAELTVVNGQCRGQIVTDPNASDHGALTSIYVEFNSTENKCEVEIGDPYKKFTAVLERNAKSDFVELKSKP
jgi:hypothetical protein